MGGTTILGGHAECALLVGCDQGPKRLGLDGDESDPYLHRPSGPPLEDEAPCLVGVLGPNRPYNRLNVPIHEEDLENG